MKKYSGVLARVRELENKRGIHYASPDGRLYKAFNVLYILMLIWGLGTNLLFMLGHILVYADSENSGEMKNRIITVSVCTLLIIARPVLNIFKKHSPYIIPAVGAALTAAGTAVLAVFFAQILQDDLGFLGLKSSFYYRHLIPLAFILIFVVIMTVIAIRAEAKTDRMYKKVTENIYNMYREKNVDINGLTDGQWNDILMNFTPDYKPVITVKDEEDE